VFVGYMGKASQEGFGGDGGGGGGGGGGDRREEGLESLKSCHVDVLFFFSFFLTKCMRLTCACLETETERTSLREKVINNDNHVIASIT
jgi:hypothetical protein